MNRLYIQLKMCICVVFSAGRLGRHHRHWQDVLARLSGCKLSMLASPLPELGTIIGGAIKLHGNDITLACFHGINFRSKHWALFTLKEPNIAFDAEVQSIRTNGKKHLSLSEVKQHSLELNQWEKQAVTQPGTEPMTSRS
jgi:hypothetical protein